MDALSWVARILIIIFGAALLAATGYVLWFAITHGLWDSIMSDANKVDSMIAQAEKNANALGGVISKGFIGFEADVVGAYKTVASFLVSTANTINTGGSDIINQIKNGGAEAITEIGTGGATAINDIKSTFILIKTETDRVISQIQTGGNAALDQTTTGGAAAISSITTEGINAITALTAAYNTLKSGTETAISTLDSGGRNAVSTVDVGVRDSIDQLTRTYQIVSTETQSAIAETQAVLNQINTGGANAIATLKATFSMIETQVSAIAQTAIINIQAASITTISSVENAGNTAISAIQSAYRTVKSGITDTSKQISSESQAIVTTMATAVLEGCNKISTFVTQSYDATSDTATNAIRQIQNAADQVNAVANSMVPQLKSTADQIASTTSSTTSKMPSDANTIINAISAKSSSIIDQINAGSAQLVAQIAREAAAAAAATNSAFTAPLPPTSAGFSQGFQNPEGFENKGVAPTSFEDSLFLNLQPLSIKDTGFLGPYPSGKYKEDAATANALKAGCRFLTLQIDYTDIKMDLSLYEAPGLPTLLVRGPDGTLQSGNSGSIKTVAETIANMAFNQIVPQNSAAVILYLHIVRAPNPLMNQEKYLSFLSKIAAELNPIAPFHLGLEALGNFTRQKMAGEILTMPMNSLDGKIIIMCNADTSAFRASTLNRSVYPPSKDLDFWVNMQVFLDESGDMNGVTQLADPSAPPSAVLVDLKRVIGLSAMNKTTFATKGKRRYVIAMGDRTTNPNPAVLGIALNQLGINAVPIDIFTDSDTSILLLSNEYQNKAFRSKPSALEYKS
jgi:hypothetical protein